jgi:hypothetical protein
MNAVFAIALNTFREATRNKIFYSLILFGVACLMLTLAVSSASLHQEVRLMKDVGLFMTSTFSVFIAVLIGINLVYQEIERKTIYTVIPKPIGRWQFLFGKYVGLLATMAVQVVVMGFVLALQFWIMGETMGIEMVQALWLIFIEILVVTAVALFFSAFSTPFLSGLLTLGIFAVGRFVDRLVELRFKPERGEAPDPVLEQIAALVRGVANVAPDLSLYNTTPYVVYDKAIDWGYVVQASLYGCTYAGITLLLAAVMFHRRDFV